MITLELFGEYDHALDIISEQVFHGYLCGSFGIVVYRNEIVGEITEEMEEFFDGDDEYEILVEWDLNIE